MKLTERIHLHTVSDLIKNFFDSDEVICMNESSNLLISVLLYHTRVVP